VCVAGLAHSLAADLDYPLDRFRAEAGLCEGVELIGGGPLVERLWTRPAIAVIALDAPRVADASNTLVPVARAKVSMRLAPGEDVGKAMDSLVEHLESHAPWGARVNATRGEICAPTVIDATGPAHQTARAAMRESWGVVPVDIGMGGSIPIIAEFMAAYPDAAILVTGVEDPDTRAHSPNEGLHLAEFERVCVAEALLLQKLSDH
jgi:cysteinylglycine-S-conjugate dipeptidase